MERTPSKERVIPIEIIGYVSDVPEDEIDINNFDENISKSSKCDKPQVENENSSSNRGSLIITHEDGSIEENECTVTCLGISSDLGRNQGLQIEEISQDTLKDKLSEDKLKVVIPDMSQVIILEADEVTDPSFMSTPEVEESSQADEISIYDDIIMYDIDYEKEECSTPRSTTPATAYKMTQEEHEDKIQHQKEGNPKQQDLVEAVDFLKLNFNTKQGANFDKTYDLAENIKNTDNAYAQKLTCGANLTVPSNDECKFLESKENEFTAVENSQSDGSKDTEILEIKINPDDEGSTEYKNTNYNSNQNSRESDRSEQIRKFFEPINKDDLNLESEYQKTNVDKAKDQDKLPLKKMLAETVRIIPITLPDGRFVERGIMSDHCVKQNEFNSSQLQDSINRVDVIYDRNSTARTIPILIESPEMPLLLKQESEKYAKEDKTFEEKEEGPCNDDSDNHMDSFNLITKSSQSSEKLSETMRLKVGTEQVNQRVESKDISNIMIGNFENKQLIDEPNRITSQLPAEEKLIQDKQSKDEIDIDSIQTDPEKDKSVQKQKSAVSNDMDELEIKKINILGDDCEISDKNKQTAVTQQGNICSDASSRHLAEGVENEEERNVPILIQTVCEVKSENINKNKITSHQVHKDGNDTKEESNTQMNSSISTESFSNQMSKVSHEETQNDNDNYQLPRDPISEELSVFNKKQIENAKIATDKESVEDKRVSIELTDSSVSTGELNIKVRDPGMGDTKEPEKKLHPEETQKENTCSSKLYRKSSEVKDVENKLIRNIPIQIETNIEGESKNIHTNESTDNDQPYIRSEANYECEKSDNIGKDNQITTVSSLEARSERDENLPIDINPVSTTSPVVRKVPIQIVGCTSEECEDQNRNIKVEAKSNNSEQIQRNIPIQQVIDHTDRNSQKSKNKIQQSEQSEAPKWDSFIDEDTKTVKQRKEIETQSKTRHQDMLSQQHGVISVPIKIQLPDETLKIHSVKEANTESKAKDEQTKISKEYHTSAGPTRTSAKLETEKLNPPRFPPPPVPTSKPPPPVPTSKPPAVVRTIPILRQSLSDSGEGMSRQQTGARQRNKSEQSTRGEILQKVHQDLEEARAKLTAQANSLSSGLENIPIPDTSKNDPRSRSVESEQRYQGSRPQDVIQKNMFKREKSLQDIDKDIETIWRELQELDKPDMENELDTQRNSRKSNRTQTPLSEQVLVNPSWRTPTPPLPPSTAVKTSLSNPNISNINTSQKPLSRTTSPHTIWNTQESMNDATTSGQLSSSWDSKPRYYLTKPSTHFSFQPKAETKPGAIKPSYVSQSPKSGHPQVRNIPIEKSESNAPTYEIPVHKGNDLQKESMKTKQAYGSSGVVKSEESLKSCIKSEASNFTIQKHRSQSPSNVKFSNKPKSAENAPKACGRNSEPDPPFEWVDFRKADGEIVKGTILPPLHRDNDVIISRDVPIINVLLDDALKEETNLTEKNKTHTMKGKEPKSQSPTATDSKHQKDNQPSETFNACDAGTQTEKFEKKGGCHIM